MKKTFSIKALGLILLGTTALFTACGDDEETSPVSGIPTLENADITNPVAWVVFDSETVYLNYANGKLVSGSNSDGAEFHVTESPLVLFYSDPGDDTNETLTMTGKNAQGYITSCKYVAVEGEDGETDTFTENMTFQYNAEGRIVRSTVSGYEPGYGRYTVDYTLTYNGDKLTKIVENEKDADGRSTYTYEYTYDSDESANPNSGIFLLDSDIIPSQLAYGGFFGKPLKNLPIRLVESYTYQYDGEEASENTNTYNLTYQRDSQGRITRILRNGYHYCAIGYNNATTYTAALNPAAKAPQAKRHGLMRRLKH